MALDSVPATLHEQIEEMETHEITYKSLHPYITIHNNQNNTDIKVPYSSITNKYRIYLLECLVKIQLTDEEKEMYRFQPKRLSMDLYGTTELWADLMKLNGAVSVVDFKPSFVTIYDPHTFKKFLNEIMIMDEDCIY